MTDDHVCALCGEPIDEAELVWNGAEPLHRECDQARMEAEFEARCEQVARANPTQTP